MKVFKVTCPHCEAELNVEVPKKPKGERKPVTEMTNEELAREIINSKSVLYKSERKGATEESLAPKRERVEIALAEKANRPEMNERKKPQAVILDEESIYANEELSEEI